MTPKSPEVNMLTKCSASAWLASDGNFIPGA